MSTFFVTRESLYTRLSSFSAAATSASSLRNLRAAVRRSGITTGRRFAMQASTSVRACPLPQTMRLATVAVLSLSAALLLSNPDSFDHTAGPRSGLQYYPAHHHTQATSSHRCLAVASPAAVAPGRRSAHSATTSLPKATSPKGPSSPYGSNKELMLAESLGKTLASSYKSS
ncbi:BZ3500_MvSof-1268-A1-R1_Chr9g10490 [Microbotryum saponariae]|uniref:BZ3500_MvSof-1268-A1-R1_Chr9g10490 protein n=1 Tax=Microbotryum saponariae TaxID=289078 RepID=A0A2X0MZV6_9BASI|nr:BZ3501_MvSof-1269-A2-R1_Chr9g10239 [Microbotryum saponariae]SDA00182.1 BZ3500_MvSof-1268-A1-R1_Chr9g10490 [Microbotryum saponariae]